MFFFKGVCVTANTKVKIIYRFILKNSTINQLFVRNHCSQHLTFPPALFPALYSRQAVLQRRNSDQESSTQHHLNVVRMNTEVKVKIKLAISKNRNLNNKDSSRDAPKMGIKTKNVLVSKNYGRCLNLTFLSFHCWGGLDPPPPL